MNNAVVKLNYDDIGIALVNNNMLSQLKINSRSSAKKRARICVHPSTESPIHEMIITLEKSSYVRPHRHLNKTESYFVISGEIELIYFDEAGAELVRYALGACTTESNSFYLRANNNFWHTLVVNSDQATILEITTGPLREEETLFAPWAPDAEHTEKAEWYLNSLRK